MKINKFLKSIEKLFFNENHDEETKEHIKDKLLEKIESVKTEIKESANEEEIKELKEKLSILNKLLKRVG
jgi:hypothetical protein